MTYQRLLQEVKLALTIPDKADVPAECLGGYLFKVGGDEVDVGCDEADLGYNKRDVDHNLPSLAHCCDPDVGVLSPRAFNGGLYYFNCADCCQDVTKHHGEGGKHISSIVETLWQIENTGAHEPLQQHEVRLQVPYFGQFFSLELVNFSPSCLRSGTNNKGQKAEQLTL